NDVTGSGHQARNQIPDVGGVSLSFTFSAVRVDSEVHFFPEPGSCPSGIGGPELRPCAAHVPQEQERRITSTWYSSASHLRQRGLHRGEHLWLLFLPCQSFDLRPDLRSTQGGERRNGSGPHHPILVGE